MTTLRVLSAIAGIGILAAVAHVTITANGGYGWSTNAPLTIALVVGVALGAPVMSLCRPALAIALFLALLAGEAYGFLATASWHVANLEAHAAPIHEAAAKRKAAEDWVARLERDDRVAQALQALHDAEADARAKSTAPDCGKGCIATLAKTVDGATAAVGEARESLQHEVAAARAALADAPLPASASPLADRLGVEPWALDLIGAGLRSFACTVLAGALLAFAAHDRPEAAAAKPKGVPVARFMVDSVEAAPRSRVESAELYAAYRHWCEDNRVRALPAPQFADALVPVLNEVGITRKTRGDDVFLVGVKLAS
jgi:hypothetical protein